MIESLPVAGTDRVSLERDVGAPFAVVGKQPDTPFSEFLVSLEHD